MAGFRQIIGVFACTTAAAEASPTTDMGWDLLATTVKSTTARTCMKAPGLPSYMHGKYIVSGPAQFELGDYKVQALFDGFGLVNKFELLPNGAEGEICYTSNWLNSSTRTTAFKRGAFCGMLFEESSPPRPLCPMTNPLCDMEVLADNDWVNMVMVGGQALALTDSHAMLKIDLETLETSGLYPWADDTPAMGGIGAPMPAWVKSMAMHVATSGSAHPTLRAGTNTYIDILSSLGPIPVVEHSFLMVFSFEADVVGPQNRTLLASLKFDHLPYVHSFGVTPNYIVLPVTHKMATVNLLRPQLLGKIQEGWMGLKIVDKSGKVHHFDLPEEQRFYHVHIVNSFENSTGVTLDVGAFAHTPFAKDGALDMDMFKNKKIRDGDTNRNTIRRIHFPFDTTGSFPDSSAKNAIMVSSSDMALGVGARSDFFKINPENNGLAYCFLYATQWWHDGENYANMAIVKHDICSGKNTYWSRPDVYVGEPTMIPAGGAGAEDAGVISFVALDGKKGKSIFVTLDASSMKEINIAEMDVFIPFTAHAQHFPETHTVNEIVV